VSNEIMPWTEGSQGGLREPLAGPWADDVWLVTPKSSKRKAVYLRFTIDSISLKLEIKYAVWSNFDSGKWSMGRDHRTLCNELALIIRWLNHFAPPIQSLMEKGVEQWEMSLRSFIIQTSHIRQRVQKMLRSTQEYVECIGEDPRICLFRQLYMRIQEAYDDRPVLEKDIWDLRILGLAVNLSDCHFKLNFTFISQPWLRDLSKTYMKYSIAVRSPGGCLIRLQAIRGFSQFLAQQYPTAHISDIDRSMIVKYISFLSTCNMSDYWRKSVLCSLRVFFETCAHQLKIEGIIREPVIFESDFPKNMKQLSREIPEEVLKQVRKHLETLDTTTMRMVVILLECGMRISELCNLPLECLICDDKHDWYLRSYQIKSKKEHIIPLVSKEVIAAIQAQQQCIREQWGSTCPYLFPGGESHTLPFKANMFAVKLNKWAVEKDIRDSSGKLYHFQSHQFRHTVGMRLINSDIPLVVISRLLGHSWLSSTQIYAYKKADVLREELERVARKHKVVNHMGEVVTNDVQTNNPLIQITRKGIRGQTLPIGGCGRPIVSGDCEHANKCLNCIYWLTSTEDLPGLKIFYNRATQLRQKAVELGNQIVVKNQEHIIPLLALRIAKLEDTSMDGSLTVVDLLAELRTDCMEVESEMEEAREQGRLVVAKELEPIVEDLKAKIRALEASL
jgi:integrase/recombinase XerD